MKKILPFLLRGCLLLSACVKIEGNGVDGTDSTQNSDRPKSDGSSADTKPEEISTEPLMLYPAYLQTPLDMPVVLDAETYPAGKKLIWTCADTSVAIVDAEGCVTPVGVGETIITCAFADDAGVTATCGVLVVTEGKILLWEYPPEPVDFDALLAYAEAKDSEQAEDTQGISWPDVWPSDLPKMEGIVTDVYGETAESSEGLTVFVAVAGVDAAKAFVSELTALGLKANEMPTGDYYVILKGNGYEIYVNYTDAIKNVLCL